MFVSSTQSLPHNNVPLGILLCGANSDTDWHESFVEHAQQAKWHQEKQVVIFYADSEPDVAWKSYCRERSQLLLFWMADSHPNPTTMYEYGTTIERAKRSNITIITGFAGKSAFFHTMQENIAEELRTYQLQSQGLTFSDMHLPFQRRCILTAGWNSFTSVIDSWMENQGASIIHWKKQQRL